MKRTTVPVLLVVLTLLSGIVASAALADTVDQNQDGAMLVPSADRHQSDTILDLYGDTDDGSGRKGDPSTLGDGFGATGDDPILTADSYPLGDDVQLIQLLLRLMDYFTILH